MDPANPPDKMLTPNFCHWGASLEVLKMLLMVSLKAKFKAWVGKYLNTLAKLPEIKEVSFEKSRIKRSNGYFLL